MATPAAAARAAAAEMSRPVQRPSERTRIRPGSPRRNQRHGQIEGVGQLRGLAAHLRGEAGELARLRRLLDGGRLGEGNDSQLVARGHGGVDDVGRLLLRRRAVRRHRKAAVHHQDRGAAMDGEADAQPAQGKQQQDQGRGPQDQDRPRGQPPPPERHRQGNRQDQPEGIAERHVPRPPACECECRMSSFPYRLRHSTFELRHFAIRAA